MLVLALAVPGVLPAPAAGAAQSAAQRKASSPPRGKRSPLDERVATLTKALGLDAKQQTMLRQVLQDQRRQVERIWLDESMTPAVRVAATRKLSTQTGDRIRALLSEEQRRKYDPPSQADPGKTIGGAHVEDWLNGGKRL
jgi:periplasmic protein CpxP/Spy